MIESKIVNIIPEYRLSYFFFSPVAALCRVYLRATYLFTCLRVSSCVWWLFALVAYIFVCVCWRLSRARMCLCVGLWIISSVFACVALIVCAHPYVAGDSISDFECQLHAQATWVALRYRVSQGKRFGCARIHFGHQSIQKGTCVMMCALVFVVLYIASTCFYCLSMSVFLSLLLFSFCVYRVLSCFSVWVCMRLVSVSCVVSCVFVYVSCV